MAEFQFWSGSDLGCFLLVDISNLLLKIVVYLRHIILSQLSSRERHFAGLFHCCFRSYLYIIGLQQFSILCKIRYFHIRISSRIFLSTHGCLQKHLQWLLEDVHWVPCSMVELIKLKQSQCLLTILYLNFLTIQGADSTYFLSFTQTVDTELWSYVPC